MAGVFSDLSNELNRHKSSQRRMSLNTGGLSRFKGNSKNEKTDAGGASDEQNLSGEGSEWVMKYAVDGRTVPEVVSEDGLVNQQAGSSAGGNNSPTTPLQPQSNWDSNFISLFVS